MSDLERTGRRLQTATIIWNLIEVFITIALGIAAGSLALVAFGLDSLIEVFASLVVLWHMSDAGTVHRDRRAQRLVAAAFALLAIYLTIASIRSLLIQAEPDASQLGIVYLAITAIVMFTLGARCWAVPVFDVAGNVTAAISTSIPTVRVSDGIEEAAVEVLAEIAGRISSQLGFRQ